MGAHCGEFRMAARLRKRLTDEERRALQLLASSPCGHTEEVLVLAHGFSRDMLAGLVLAGLATVVTETVRAGGPATKVERYRITDDGRRRSKADRESAEERADVARVGFLRGVV
jgi:hypothetical protein